MKGNKMGGVCSMHWKEENAYKVSVGKAEGKRPHGEPNYRWEDNIKIDPGYGLD
jgi:hypothetical protein